MAPRAPLVALVALALVAPSHGSGAVCREGEADCAAGDLEEAGLLQQGHVAHSAFSKDGDLTCNVVQQPNTWCSPAGWNKVDVKLACSKYCGTEASVTFGSDYSSWKCFCNNKYQNDFDLQKWVSYYSGRFEGSNCCQLCHEQSFDSWTTDCPYQGSL